MREDYEFDIDQLEWKKLYPIKKILAVLVGVTVVLLELFQIIYLIIGSLERDIGNVSRVLFFLLITIFYTKWMLQYLKSPYLVVPKVSRYLAKDSMRQNIRSQRFQSYQSKGISEKDFMESDDWYYINQRFIPKRMLAGFTSVYVKNRYAITFWLINGDVVEVEIPNSTELRNKLRENDRNSRKEINFNAVFTNPKPLKEFYEDWIRNNNPLDLIIKEEAVNRYITEFKKSPGYNARKYGGDNEQDEDGNI